MKYPKRDAKDIFLSLIMEKLKGRVNTGIADYIPMFGAFTSCSSDKNVIFKMASSQS